MTFDSKRCSKCHTVKPLSEFHVDRGKRDGHVTQCKQCVAARDKARFENKYHRGTEFYARKYLSSHRHNLKKKFGLTPEQHKQMYLDQNGCCAMCGEPVEYTRIHTDHDHNTNKVRGLLCARCNCQIAIFDNYSLFSMAVEYLERDHARISE